MSLSDSSSCHLYHTAPVRIIRIKLIKTQMKKTVANQLRRLTRRLLLSLSINQPNNFYGCPSPQDN
jgi:hypothetical protein